MYLFSSETCVESRHGRGYGVQREPMRIPIILCSLLLLLLQFKTILDLLLVKDECLFTTFIMYLKFPLQK